jgi:C1A family cysteine protease
MSKLILLALCTVSVAAKYSRGYVRQAHAKNYPVLPRAALQMDAVPDRVDWSVNATTPVKDQGSCGSCWAFSTIEGVESSIFMATGKLPELSTEELVSCDKGADGGCDGGDIPTGAKYLKKNGVASAADYPDKSSKSGRTGKCTWNKKTVATVSGFQYALPQCERGDCSKQDEATLAAALAQYGPISICINSGDGQSGDWAKYKSGILKGSCKAQANLIDHCVQLVGYDKAPANGDAAYWKIRNSWAASYGEEGFIRIPYGQENTCCVACEAVIISAKPITA